MTNEKYFLDWAKEYEDSASVLAERIAQLREEKKKVRLSEQIELDERIKILTAMKYDCENTKKILVGKASHERIKARRRAVAY